MLRRLRFRPVGWLVALGTFAAMAATMVVAAPGSAATEKTYASTFKMECIIGPGSVNIKGTLTTATQATGPETVKSGETGVEFHNSFSLVTSPSELGQPLFNGGVREVRGFVVNFTLDSTGAEPAELNIAKPAEFPSGLPYHAPVENEKATTFRAPTEGTFSFGPYTVTGAAGTHLVSHVTTEPGFEENPETGFKSTGKGVQSTLEGYNEHGEKLIGPLPVSCTALEEGGDLVLATIPIESGGTTTTTTSHTTTTTTTTHTTTTTTTTEAAPEVIFHEWVLKGFVHDKKLGENITLPAGCKFNGHATVPGPLEANTSCPAFSDTVKILGLLPSTIGLEIKESEPIHGTITPAGAGELKLTGTAKDNIFITSISLFGLKIPTSCKTVSPVIFPLESTAPASALATGTTFTGETTLPNVSCSGGLLGALFGPVLSTLMSGPNNPFSLTVEP